MPRTAAYERVGLKEAWIKPVLTEMFGTMVFVAFGTFQIVNHSIISSAFSHGLCLVALIASLAKISGAHFNPCVTIAVTAGSKFNIFRAVLYILAQLGGAMIGSAWNLASIGRENFSLNKGGMTLGSMEEISSGNVFVADFFLSALFILTFLMVAIDEPHNPLAALYIGLAYTAAVFAGGKISGASLNPARSFGPWAINAAVSGEWKFDQWPFYIASVLSSVIIGLTYRFFLKREIVKAIEEQNE